MQARTKVLIIVLTISAAMCGGCGILVWATMPVIQPVVVEGVTLRVQVRNDAGVYCANTENLARATAELRARGDAVTVGRWVLEDAI